MIPNIYISMALFALLGFLFAWKIPASRIAKNWFTDALDALLLKRIFAALVNTPLQLLADLSREMLALCRGAAARIGGGCRPPLQWIGAMLVFLLLLATRPAQAVPQSFSFTNIIQSAVTVTSYPTNTTTTNYWSAGVLPGQTNQYLLNWLTGKPIEVRNYESADFVFSANITSSNLANMAFFLVRGSALQSANGTPGSPVVLINTNNSSVLYNDWETPLTSGGSQPNPNAAFIQINIPIPAGTNYAFNWRTNFPVGSADYIGIWQETNNISFGVTAQCIGYASNIVAALDKKIRPLRYP